MAKNILKHGENFSLLLSISENNEILVIIYEEINLYYNILDSMSQINSYEFLLEHIDTDNFKLIKNNNTYSIEIISKYINFKHIIPKIQFEILNNPQSNEVILIKILLQGRTKYYKNKHVKLSDTVINYINRNIPNFSEIIDKFNQIKKQIFNIYELLYVNFNFSDCQKILILHNKLITLIISYYNDKYFINNNIDGDNKNKCLKKIDNLFFSLMVHTFVDYNNCLEELIENINLSETNLPVGCYVNESIIKIDNIKTNNCCIS